MDDRSSAADLFSRMKSAVEGVVAVLARFSETGVMERGLFVGRDRRLNRVLRPAAPALRLQHPVIDVDQERTRERGAPEQHPVDHLRAVDEPDLDRLLDAAEPQRRLDEQALVDLAVARAHARSAFHVRAHVHAAVALFPVQHDVESDHAARQLADVLDVQRAAARARVDLRAEPAHPPVGEVHVLRPPDHDRGAVALHGAAIVVAARERLSCLVARLS